MWTHQTLPDTLARNSPHAAGTCSTSQPCSTWIGQRPTMHNEAPAHDDYSWHQGVPFDVARRGLAMINAVLDDPAPVTCSHQSRLSSQSPSTAESLARPASQPMPRPSPPPDDDAQRTSPRSRRGAPCPAFCRTRRPPVLSALPGVSPVASRRPVSQRMCGRPLDRRCPRQPAAALLSRSSALSNRASTRAYPRVAPSILAATALDHPRRGTGSVWSPRLTHFVTGPSRGCDAAYVCLPGGRIPNGAPCVVRGL